VQTSQDEEAASQTQYSFLSGEREQPRRNVAWINIADKAPYEKLHKSLMRMGELIPATDWGTEKTQGFQMFFPQGWGDREGNLKPYPAALLYELLSTMDLHKCLSQEKIDKVVGMGSEYYHNRMINEGFKQLLQRSPRRSNPSSSGGGPSRLMKGWEGAKGLISSPMGQELLKMGVAKGCDHIGQGDTARMDECKQKALQAQNIARTVS